MEEMTWRGPGTVDLRLAYCSRLPELHEPIQGRPGLMRPSVLPLLCPTNDYLSAVQVGSSSVAARLLFLAPIMSCAFTVQVAGQCREATDDGGYKIVVAHAVGHPGSPRFLPSSSHRPKPNSRSPSSPARSRNPRCRRGHGEAVPRAAGGLQQLVLPHPPPPPYPRNRRLPSTRLRAAPPLHFLRCQPPPFHVLRHRPRSVQLGAAPLRRRPHRRLRRLLRGRAAAPRGARHQHAPDLAEDALHPPPAPLRRHVPPRRRRPLRPFPLPALLRPLPAPRRQVPLRDRPRLGHRRVALPLLRILHALRRAPRRSRPLQVRQPRRVLHAPHGHLLRGLPLPAAGRRAHLRRRHGVRAVVNQGLHQAASGARIHRRRAQGTHCLRVLARLHALLSARHLLMLFICYERSGSKFFCPMECRTAFDQPLEGFCYAVTELLMI